MSGLWTGPISTHGVWIDVDGPSVLIRVNEDAEVRSLIYEEAMDVRDVFHQATAAATRNALEPEEES